MTGIDLRTGYSCDQHCRFCDQGVKREGIADATAAEVLERVPAGASEVWLAGGEVTLRPDLLRMISALRERGVKKVGLQTHGGILAAPGAAASLARAGLTDAAVSLHGSRPELHDWLAGTEGSFRGAVLSIRRLVAAQVRVTLHTVMTRSGMGDLPFLTRLGGGMEVRHHRFMMLRPQGNARISWPSLAPRFPLLQAPLLNSLSLLSQVFKRTGEVLGVPLCFLPGWTEAAGDRLDRSGKVRLFPSVLRAAEEETSPEGQRQKGPPCLSCSLAGECRGPEREYVQRYGWDEFIPVSPGVDVSPSGVSSSILLQVEAPCDLGCPRCLAREARRGEWGEEEGRKLRQRLVRAAGEGVREIAFVGGSPWSHPELVSLVWEAERLGFTGIEVWGPLHPLLKTDEVRLRRLAPLTRARVPRFAASEENHDRHVGRKGAWEQGNLAMERLRMWAPRCTIEVYSVDAASSPPANRPPPYLTCGPQAVWPGCEPAGG